MVRHFVGLQSLVYTLHQAYKDLGLILIIVAVTVLMFSSLVYAFEQESRISKTLLLLGMISFPYDVVQVMITRPGHSMTASGGG